MRIYIYNIKDVYVLWYICKRIGFPSNRYPVTSLYTNSTHNFQFSMYLYKILLLNNNVVFHPVDFRTYIYIHFRIQLRLYEKASLRNFDMPSMFWNIVRATGLWWIWCGSCYTSPYIFCLLFFSFHYYSFLIPLPHSFFFFFLILCTWLHIYIHVEVGKTLYSWGFLPTLDARLLVNQQISKTERKKIKKKWKNEK